MKKQTITYTATSKTGQVEIIKDSREFSYGFFSHLTETCTVNNCDWCCIKGKVEFHGVSKNNKKSIKSQLCPEKKFETEVVDLVIV